MLTMCFGSDFSNTILVCLLNIILIVTVTKKFALIKCSPMYKYLLNTYD